MTQLEQTVANTNDISLQKVKSDYEKREKIIKELFDMVYKWGRYNVVVNDNAPAYRETIKELLKI